ncbi:hypothetical protein [Treponema berlinense]|nr:hypothetical protein [Treponema berlinense]
MWGFEFYSFSGGFLVALIPSTGSGTKATKKQALQGSAIASFLREVKQA